MKRVLLRVSYDGTAYCGFQYQPDLPTIEGELNRALKELTGEKIAVIGASRTDSGVHALGNAAVFDTDSPIPGERFFAALNTKLPADIRITESEEVPADWHPRKQKCVKTYEYRVDTAYVPDPLKSRFCMHWPRKMDVEAMRRAAGFLVGEHDFTSFANPSSQVLKEGGSPVRTLYSVEILTEGTFLLDSTSPELTEGTFLSDSLSPAGGSVSSDHSEKLSERNVPADSPEKLSERNVPADSRRPFITIRVTGDGFLYNMVRIIAGTLLDVGTGRFSPEDVKKILEAKDRTKAGITAEPQGLKLVSIRYTGREKDRFTR